MLRRPRARCLLIIQAAPILLIQVVRINVNGGSGNKNNQKMQSDSEPAATEDLPEGAEPLEVDLFQSESRMVLFVQMSGVSPDDFEITTDEEANILVIQATQKRPELPPVAIIPGSDTPAEKGRFVKQEVKWKLLYRKVYLPAPFLGSEAAAIFVKGVLVVTLPVKRLGIGKKLVVKEIIDEKKPA